MGEDVREFIAKLADIAEAVGEQAGVGGLEIAGAIVSYLANHPEDLDRFLEGGFMELPLDSHRHGRLTWHARNGKVISPEYARRAIAIKKLAGDA